MKKTFIFIILLSFIFETSAQKIEIRSHEKQPYQLSKNVTFEVFLINNTNKSLKYFDSRTTGWGCFRDKWDLKIDGKPAGLNSFFDGYEGKYTEKTIITLLPGEEREIRGLLTNIKSPGHYALSYTQTQSPSLVNKKYAKNQAVYSATQNINNFTVTDTLKFNIEGIKVKELTEYNEMTWEEWTDFKKENNSNKKYKYTDLKKALENLDNVYSLDLNCNGLSESMIKEIGKLKNLRWLSLDDFKNEIFPEEIASLNLYELHFFPSKDANIKYPFGLSKNKTLRYLTARFKNIVPKEVTYLINLEKLDLSSGQTKTVPNLGSLINLKELSFSGTEITSIENIGLEKLQSLKGIDLGTNYNLTNIDAISACKNLEIIECRYSKLTKLPDDIDKLTKLQELHLGMNKSLTYLPKSIVNLPNIRLINLAITKITELPEGFANLPLESFVITGTKCKKTKDYKILKKRLDKKFQE